MGKPTRLDELVTSHGPHKRVVIPDDVLAKVVQARNNGWALEDIATAVSDELGVEILREKLRRDLAAFTRRA